VLADTVITLKPAHLLTSLASNSLSLTVRFNSHLPGGPWFAATRMSPFWTLLELRTMEMVVTTGATRRAKFHAYRHHQQNPTLCRPETLCLPTNSVRALKGKLCPQTPKLEITFRDSLCGQFKLQRLQIS